MTSAATTVVTFAMASRYDELLIEFRSAVLDVSIAANDQIPNVVGNGRTYPASCLAPVASAMADAQRKFDQFAEFLESPQSA